MSNKKISWVSLILSIVAIAGGALFFAPDAEAEGGYIGVSGAYLDTDVTNHTAVNLHGGYNFNSVLSMEGRVLVNSSEEGYHGASVEIDSLWGLYIMANIPVSDSLSVYGLFGYSDGEATASYGGHSETGDDSSGSMGFGIKYDLLEAWSVRFEHTQLFDDMDSTAVTLTLNF